MKEFAWIYFAKYSVGMLALYWSVFIIAAAVRSYSAAAGPGRWFTKDLGFAGYFYGAIAGAITPFCSCSTVPVFLGMVDSGVRLGYCMSFLICSPLIDPPTVILFTILFGLPPTAAFIFVCFAISILGGVILGHERFRPLVGGLIEMQTGERPRFSMKAASTGYLRFLPKLVPVVLIAATVATALKGWIPPMGVFDLISRHALASIPAASVLGGAIYSELGLLLPIGKLLVSKGMNIGVVFSFMMASAGISIPSVLLLSRIMRPRFLVLYVITSLVLFSLSGFTIMGLKAAGVI